MWRKGRQSWEVWKIQTRTFSESPWHSVLPSPSFPCPSIRNWLPLSTPVDTRYTIWAPNVSYLHSWEISDFTTANQSPFQAQKKKKIPSISVISACLGWTLVFSGRKHSDGWNKSECWNHLHPLWLQVPLFLVFFAVYTVSVMGNLGMILIIRINPKLHTHMHFFLSHLSFLDFCYSSITTPKLLEILVVDTRTIF